MRVTWVICVRACTSAYLNYKLYPWRYVLWTTIILRATCDRNVDTVRICT